MPNEFLHRRLNLKIMSLMPSSLHQQVPVVQSPSACFILGPPHMNPLLSFPRHLPRHVLGIKHHAVSLALTIMGSDDRIDEISLHRVPIRIGYAAAYPMRRDMG